MATGAVSLAAGGILVLGSGAAFAGTAPAWEPDAQTPAPYAGIVFYDANGNEITSGNNFSDLFAYAAGASGPVSGYNTVTLSFANPNPALPTASWTATSENANGAFPVTSPPADIALFEAGYPVADTSGLHGSDTGADLATWLQSNTVSTTPGYANIVQVRMITSGSRGKGASAPGDYWSADIAYNNGSSPITVDGVSVAAGTWQELYPAVNPTTTTLTAAQAGAQVTLNATEFDSASNAPQAGYVQFYDNGTAFGAPQATTNGTASFTGTPGSLTDTFTASFIPTVGDEAGAQTTAATIEGESTSAGVTVPISATPESPLTVLLPTSVIGIGAAGILFGRRRNRRAAQG